MESNERDAKSGLDLNASVVKNLLVQFLRDETNNAGFHCGVLGVSGGVDSAVSAFLTAEALGKENTIGVLMPYKTSSRTSVEDAKVVIERLGIRTELVDISAMVDAYCDLWKVTDQVRRGNVMARMRMIVLYDISAREQALVIGTSNKTEYLGWIWNPLWGHSIGHQSNWRFVQEPGVATCAPPGGPSAHHRQDANSRSVGRSVG